MELEEYKFDHFKNIDEVMHYFNYWYKEEDVYSINRYLSLKDFNYISNKYQELQKENKKIKKQNKFLMKRENKLQVLEMKQKEFILYLRHLSNWYSADGVKQGMVNEILQNYKQIIGVSDETN